jgi:sigma-E factor negative regulatory protein RseA
MVMGEDISRLVDGELDDARLDVAFAQLKQPGGMETWVCYHLIGDTLRSCGEPSPGFSARFATRLAAEPTVLAPRTQPARPLAYAWAAAAGVAAAALVAWVAFNTMQGEPAVIAKANEATNARPVQFPARTVPADYLLAHQEYSPTAQIQGVSPYLRSVSAPLDGARP